MSMTKEALRQWREAEAMTQEAAAAVCGVSRALFSHYEAGRRTIPPEVERRTQDSDASAAAEVKARPVKAQRSGKARVKGAAKAAQGAPAAEPGACTPEIAAALERKPLFSKTSAEGRAMRLELARRRGCYSGEVQLIPLRPDWRRIPGTERKVNAAIPSPVATAAPEWAGERGVMTSDGQVFDFETAHRMQAFSRF